MQSTVAQKLDRVEPAAQLVPPRPRLWRELLAHPLVVGAAVVVLSGLLASLLIPALTRVWQDRPKELALKQLIAERISQTATQTVSMGASFGATVHTSGQVIGKEKRFAFVHRADRKWSVDSSVVETSLSTYFHRNFVVSQWKAYEGAVSRFLWYAGTTGNPARENLHALAKHFRLTRFRNADAENNRRLFVAHPDYFEIEAVRDLLIHERDAIVNRILDSNAYGFSHGFWIFR